mgnify:FL=1
MTIVNIKESNIEKIDKLIQTQRVVCYYYSDNCPYCIVIKSTWAEICDKYKRNCNVTIININRKFMNLMNPNYHVNMVPSIITYNKGAKVSEFSDNRDKENFVKYIENNIRLANSENNMVKSKKPVKKLKDTKKPIKKLKDTKKSVKKLKNTKKPIKKLKDTKKSVKKLKDTKKSVK